MAAQSIATENFEKNYQTYKPNFDKIDQLLIDPQNPVDFIQFLEDTATNLKITSQISLPSYALSSQPVSQNFITFRFSTKGTFPQVLSFAKAIEMGTYLVEIESLTIQNSQENTPLKNNTSKDNVQIQKTVDAAFTIEAFTKQ